MIQITDGERRRAFSHWLRTGRVPKVRDADGVERKFNPWHDPDDGRFTFAGTGSRFGSTRARDTAGVGGGRAPQGVLGRRSAKASSRTSSQAPARRAPEREKAGASPVRRDASRSSPKRAAKPSPPRGLEVASEFVGGFGEGFHETAAGAAKAAYSAVTTNPATTIRQAQDGVAQIIDTALAGENTPARVQLSHAVDAVAHASARDIGRAVGSVTGDAALAVVPGATIAKVSALRRLRLARRRVDTYEPLRVEWVKENLGPDSASKRYNDSAPGARAGQAPALKRTMPDGSQRNVKFDGVEGDSLIDRKTKIVTSAKSRAQILRQSEALRQHGKYAIYELPNAKQKAKAFKLLKRVKVTNIKVRVVKP